jgi:protein ImuB
MSRIACVWIPRFAAQAEQPRHEAGARPLLVADGRQVIGVCATALGVQEGDLLRQALARCPDALVVQADPTYYQEVWERILEALAQHAPIVESDGRGTAYLDAAGMGALYGSEGVWCETIQAEIRQAAQMAGQVGVAAFKFAAFMAAKQSTAEPGYEIVQGSDRGFLAAFPVGILPLNEETRRRLGLLGILTLGDFARLPATAVAEQFGPESLQAQRWAKGEDDRPLAGLRRKVVEVHLDFDVPEDRQDPLLEAMAAMSRKSLEQLARNGLAIRRIALEAQLAGGETWERSAWVGELPGPRKLRAVLEGLLNGLHGDGNGVTEVRLTFAGLEPAVGRQLDLFAHADGRLRLEETLRKLAQKHSRGCVVRASVASPDALLIRDRYELKEVEP